VVLTVIFVLYRDDPFFLEGFGTVFDGQTEIGNLANLANMSTQGVLELVGKIQADNEDLVKIDGQEIEEFNIPRKEESSNDQGNYFLCAVKMHWYGPIRGKLKIFRLKCDFSQAILHL
jgi:hypothetical protein